MSRRKVDALKQLSPYVARRHYACRIRLDVWDSLKAECKKLNCSQGVYLEVALQKVLLGGLVRSSDVYEYSASLRWFETARNRMERGDDFFGKKLEESERQKLIGLFSRVIAGEFPLDHPLIEKIRIARSKGGVISNIEKLVMGTTALPLSHKPRK